VTSFVDATTAGSMALAPGVPGRRRREWAACLAQQLTESVPISPP
jgi:hypothetical protein